MILLIASDIHGSAEFSEQLLAACEDEDPDQILLLGDLLYHGPRNALPADYDTKRTMEILNALRERVIAVCGNCDAEVDQMVLTFPIMNTYEVLDVDGMKFFAAHGHNYNPQNPPAFIDFDVMLNGHTHIPMLEEYNDFYCMNPGSISIPKGGSKNSYMIYEDGMFALKKLSSQETVKSLAVRKKRV